MDELTKRELWLMKQAFEAAKIYDRMEHWLEDDIADAVTVQMGLEKYAPKPHEPEVMK